MSTRFRITIRGLGVELRGYMDQGIDEDQPTLEELAEAMKPFGVVVASEAERDYNPFAEWTGHLQDRLARLSRNIGHFQQRAENAEATLKADIDPKEMPLRRRIVMQRREIREAWNSSAMYQRMWRRVKGQQQERELHHFETEQILERVQAARSNHPECDVHKDDDPVTCGWKMVVQDIDKALAHG